VVDRFSAARLAARSEYRSVVLPFSVGGAKGALLVACALDVVLEDLVPEEEWDTAPL